MSSQLRRERFLEELESYTKQVDELQSLGDMAEITKYLKKAQTLDKKLQVRLQQQQHLRHTSSFV